MLARVRSHFLANAVAYLALFVALGGSSYAALRVGSKQIRNNSVRSVDVRNNSLRGKDIRRGTLTGSDVRESSLSTVPQAENANRLGGLGAGAFERSDRVKRFGPLTDTAASTDPTVTFGPFRFSLLCQFGGQDVISASSTETGAVLSWSLPADNGSVSAFSTNGLGSAPINLANSMRPPGYSKPVEGWALARSGFRSHFSFWFGRGILGADGNTCSFGGEFRRG